MLKNWYQYFLPAGLVLAAGLGLVVSLDGHDGALFPVFIGGYLLTIAVAELAIGKDGKSALAIAVKQGIMALIASFFATTLMGISLMLLMNVTSQDINALTIAGFVALAMLGAAGGLDKPFAVMLAGVGVYMTTIAALIGVTFLVNLAWPSDGNFLRLAFGAIFLLPLLCLPAYFAALTREKLT